MTDWISAFDDYAQDRRDDEDARDLAKLEAWGNVRYMTGYHAGFERAEKIDNQLLKEKVQPYFDYELKKTCANVVRKWVDEAIKEPEILMRLFNHLDQVGDLVSAIIADHYLKGQPQVHYDACTTLLNERRGAVTIRIPAIESRFIVDIDRHRPLKERAG